ncbi:Stf0 family sulfotransferase [Enterovibrio norvegicus]|uniref:Stf0 family sulfotransferase n=1 Tax=Enterovibrio norvegicus TaxID=188144 RepID=UPI001E46B799|nr:Stf0 family sulfotransferase [Enterovibrio norvegicus]MCC4801063.1 Stf0 sulfotransferase family protein [Enterovibrio norvegicus]
MNTKILILCGTQRCGSTMIVSDLRMTGKMGNPEEYFIPWTSNVISDPLRNFENIVNSSRTENGISSIKIMADQLFHIDKNLRDAGAFELNDSDNKFIYPYARRLLLGSVFVKINRLDVIAQSVSRLMAKSTGKNHLISAESTYVPGNKTYSNSGYNDEVTFDSTYLDEQVLSISKENSIWDFVISNWVGKPDLNLIYENCIDDRSYLGVMSSLLGFDVDSCEIPPREIKKIGNEKNSEFIKDYILSSSNPAGCMFTSSDSISDFEVSCLRDVSLKLDSVGDRNCLPLIKIASKLRPSGVFIKLKLDEFRSKYL